MDRVVSWPAALGVAGLMFVLGLAGIWVATVVRGGGRVWVRRALGLASGFMFAFALVEILPEAIDQAALAPVAAVLGFIAFYMIERLFDIHLCPAGADECSTVGQHEHAHAPFSAFASVGLGAHAVVDGLAIGGAMTVSPALALLVALAVALHKLPDGFCMGSLLCAETETGRPFSWRLPVLFAFATPAGLLAAYGGLVGASGQAIGLVLGFAGGSFLYVASADLLPEAHSELRNRADRWAAMAAVSLGAILAVVLAVLGRA